MSIGAGAQLERRAPREKLNLNILLADDNAELRDMTAETLRSMGCTVEEVENGEELIARLASSETREFGLVLTDIEMPGLNGEEALSKIRGNVRFEKLPIVLYSGNSQKIVSRENSGEIYLSKPFTQEELRNAIHRALDKYAQ